MHVQKKNTRRRMRGFKLGRTASITWGRTTTISWDALDDHLGRTWRHTTSAMITCWGCTASAAITWGPYTSV